MKRVIAALFAAAVLGLTFAGCGEREKSVSERFQESNEKLGQKYAEALEGIGDYKEAVEEASGISEYEIEAAIIYQSDFDKVSEGMTYEDTMETLGAKVDSAVEGETMFTCVWHGAGGAFALISFFNGKVTFSSASGLSDE